MPKGPKGQKRPADVIGNAVKVMRIATGQETEDAPVKSAAATLGSLGGKARAASLSSAKRKAIARKAAKERWREKVTSE
ncbi:MAG: RNA-binding protein [Proteobacteria bacterium]|nr:RNA-binding protein [Pseudomonadota bacterium]